MLYKQAAYKLAEEVYKDTNTQGNPGAGPQGSQGAPNDAPNNTNANSGNSSDTIKC